VDSLSKRKKLKAKKMPKNARPTHRQLHAVLGALTERQPRELEPAPTAKLKKLLHTIYPLATDKKHDFLTSRIRPDRLKLKMQRCQPNKLDSLIER
jgi:hypothetical protein